MLHFPELLVNFICFCVLAGFNTRPGHSEKMFHPGGGNEENGIDFSEPFSSESLWKYNQDLTKRILQVLQRQNGNC